MLAIGPCREDYCFVALLREVATPARTAEDAAGSSGRRPASIGRVSRLTNGRHLATAILVAALSGRPGPIRALSLAVFFTKAGAPGRAGRETRHSPFNCHFTKNRKV